MLEKNKDGKLDSIIKDFIQSAENNKKLAGNITKYAFSIRALRENIARAYIETICELIKERNNMETIPSKDYKVISIYFVGAVTLLGQWLVNGMPYPKNDLKEAIILAAPQAVKDYLAGNPIVLFYLNFPVSLTTSLSVPTRILGPYTPAPDVTKLVIVSIFSAFGSSVS